MSSRQQLVMQQMQGFPPQAIAAAFTPPPNMVNTVRHGGGQLVQNWGGGPFFAQWGVPSSQMGAPSMIGATMPNMMHA
eukprot:5549940-Pyramimonas_sp.AAC.1